MYIKRFKNHKSPVSVAMTGGLNRESSDNNNIISSDERLVIHTAAPPRAEDPRPLPPDKSSLKS